MAILAICLVTLALANPTGGARIEWSLAAAFIVDDDTVLPQGAVGFAAATTFQDEEQGTANVTLTRNYGTQGELLAKTKKLMGTEE